MELLDPTEISRAIQARHLATPMAHAFTLTPGDSAPAAAALMHSRQFNFAPVMDSSRVLGIFESTPAPQAGTVDEYMRVLTADVLVSSDMALPELVELLCEQPFVLVLQGHHIAGLITPVDLFSAPARTHFYLRLACTEMLLAQYLRRVHPDQATAIAQLPASAQNRHRKIAAQLRASDDFLDDIAALSLADLVRLAGNDESFRDRTLARGGRGWRWQGRRRSRRRGDPAQARHQGDRPDRQAAHHPGGHRAAQDPVRQDHAPSAARRGRAPSGGRRDNPRRLLGDGHDLRRSGRQGCLSRRLSLGPPIAPSAAESADAVTRVTDVQERT